MLPRKDTIKDFLQAYRKNAVCVVGPLCSHVAHTKIGLTFLSSTLAENLFTDEEITFIKNHVPWTRPLTNDPEFIANIIANKDDFFIKPHNSNSGKGVHAGEEFDTASFTKEIDEILKHKNQVYIAQKKIPIPTDLFISDDRGSLKEFKVNVSSFVFNNKIAGFFTRVSSGSVINTDRGALVVPMFTSAIDH